MQISLKTSPASGPFTGAIKRMALAAVLALLAVKAASAANNTWLGATDNTFGTGANWSLGVSTSGDTPVFNAAGAPGATLNNNNTAFSYAGFTFNAAASAYTFTNNGFTLTGNVANNSVNPQVFNLSITNTAARTFTTTAGGGNLTLAGALSGAGGITTAGTGTLTISGTDAWTGANTVAAGTILNITGNIEPPGVPTTSTMTIGNGVGNAVVNFSGGFLTNYNYNIGTVAGAVGAFYQTAGYVTNSQGPAGTAFQIGNAPASGSTPAAYGYYYIGAGATFGCGEIGIGGENSPSGNGLMEINGGTVVDNGYLVMARGNPGASAQTGVLNIYSGSLSYAGGGLNVNWGTAGTSIINVMGGLVSNSIAIGILLNDSGDPGNLGILNLDGGVVQALSVATSVGGIVNFNTGTLRASANSGAFVTTLGSAYVYGGGGKIDNNGFIITISQPLLAPTGNGVAGITSFTAGSGYVAPPIVTVVPGAGDTTGIGATAIAQINPTTGVVTNVFITCAGVNYTATPTFTLTGGGASTPATITGAAPVANTSGGMTFVGSGTTILKGFNNFSNAVNTYTGTTTVSNGTLVLSSSQGGAGPIVVNDGATLGVNAFGASQLSPSALTLGASTGATLLLQANSTAPLTTASLKLIGSNVIKVAGSLTAATSYPLLTATAVTGGGTLNVVLPNGVTGNITTNAGTYTLNVTAVVPTIWTGAINGAWDITNTANWSLNSVAGTYVDGGPIQFDDTGLITIVTNISGTIVSPNSIIVNNSVKGYSLQTVIAGAGGLTKNGTATVTNTYSGPTVINAGVIQAGVGATAGVSSAIGNNSAVTLANVASAALNINGFSTQIGSLSGGGATGGNVILGGNTLTVGGDDTTTTYAGSISGTSGLTKIGTGALTLSGSNSFTGGTTVQAGTLNMNGIFGAGTGLTSGSTFVKSLVNIIEPRINNGYNISHSKPVRV